MYKEKKQKGTILDKERRTGYGRDNSLGDVEKCHEEGQAKASKRDLKMLKRLKAYHSTHQSTTVPAGYTVKKNGRTIYLGRWVEKIRQKYRRGELDAMLLEELNSLGFAWPQEGKRAIHRDQDGRVAKHNTQKPRGRCQEAENGRSP